MTHVLSAGDHFILPAALTAALLAAPTLRESATLTFTEIGSEWPMEPFGPVEGVDEASGDVDQLIAALEGVEVAVTHLAPFTARVFAARSELKFVGVCRGGPVNVDLAAATEAGVIVSFAPARNAQAAAEFAIGLMLATMRRISIGDAELKNGNWRGDYYRYDKTGLEISGNTIGLAGYGAIGQIVAKILLAFGATVCAYDPYANVEAAAAQGVTIISLEEMMRRSNVVSIHARLTPETHHLINADNLALLPRGAVLINSARGDLLDYAPLPAMLESGHLGGLGLDVYDEEPPSPSWPLFGAPNVVMTPHLAGATRQTAERAATVIANEAALFMAGELPKFIANPDVLERLGMSRP
jgi:D-3-phosphoglycerate dehydrogenase